MDREKAIELIDGYYGVGHGEQFFEIERRTEKMKASEKQEYLRMWLGEIGLSKNKHCHDLIEGKQLTKEEITNVINGALDLMNY